MTALDHRSCYRNRRLHLRPLVGAVALLVALVALSGCGSAATADALPPTAAPVPAATGSLTRNDVNAWLDGLVPAALNSTGIAGAGVTVVSDGKVLTARGYGKADTGTGATPDRPVDPKKTLFRIGSVSKTFTATAVMQLVEQGKIDLDVDVNTYLDFAVTEPRGTITVRHLLSHTAGFEEQIRSVLVPPGTTLDLRAFVTNQPEQIFTPGTVPAYSNYGNSLAGYIVQRVSGQQYSQYVHDHLLERAGMTSSSLEQPLPATLSARLSQAYPDSSQPAAPFEMVAASPAGGLSATPADMGRYMLAQLGELSEAQSLVRPETLAQMYAPALGADTLGAFAQGPRMTLGFFDVSRHGHKILGHLGDTSLFHSSMELYPDDRTGIFVTLNSAGKQPVDSSMLREAVTAGFADRYFPGSAQILTPQPTAAAHAAQAAGRYESSRTPRTNFGSLLRLNGQTLVTARTDGTIIITPAPGPAAAASAAYVEVRPWVWQEVGGSNVITMRSSGEQVDAIAYFSAFTLLRADIAHTTTVALAVMVSSLVALLLSAVGWPLAALRRRHGAAPVPAGTSWARVGTRIGVGAALTATLGWFGVLRTILINASPPDFAVLAVQVVQLIAVLGVVPAAAQAVALMRSRASSIRLIGALAVLLALVGVAWFALTFRMVGVPRF